MGKFEDMAMFIRIVDAGGIGKASEQLNIAKSAVSRRLTELEQRLGTQLLRRTTRKYSLTDAGRHYYRQAKGIVEEIQQLDEETSGQSVALEGVLKFSAPLSFGLLHLTGLVDEYIRTYPQLRLHIDLTDRHIDLVEEGYEMAIRIGQLRDSSYQAKYLTTVKLGFFASTNYLEKYGNPDSLASLSDHVFLSYESHSQSAVELRDQDGKTHILKPQNKIRANNGDFLKTMAIRGHGIAHLPTFLCYEEVSQGTLTPVLSNYQTQAINAYAVYPKNRFLSRRCRAFIDFIAERLGPEPYWDKLV